MRKSLDHCEESPVVVRKDVQESGRAGYAAASTTVIVYFRALQGRRFVAGFYWTAQTRNLVVHRVLSTTRSIIVTLEVAAMPFPSQRSSLAQLPGNVSTTERWLSAAAGLGLLLSAARGDALGRIARGGAGLSLLIRGTTGYCAVKGAVQGETTLRNGFVRQWQRLAEKAETVRALSSEGAQIDSMETLYGAELQELHSAEMQFCALANELVPSIGSSSLAFRIQEYATELQARKVDLDSLLARAGLDAREHPDDAMRALVHETHKMAHVCVEGVRDAAVAASLQRIIHYKIAGYGTIASYAKALGRIEEAGHFAQSADRDKAIDAELTELAKETLNAQALQAPHTEATPMTTH